MKKIKYLMAAVLAVFGVLLPMDGASAVGGVVVSASNLSVATGGTATFFITATNAAGRVDIASSDSGVATVSTASEFLDNSSATVTVSGVSSGTAVITVSVTDVTSYDDESLSGDAYTVTVAVNDPIVDTPVAEPEEEYYDDYDSGPSLNVMAPVMTPRQVEVITETAEPDSEESKAKPLGSNAKVTSIKVRGYEVKLVNGIYYATVPYETEEIEIVVDPDDSKAKVSNDGKHQLEVGKNMVKIMVEAEDGTKKLYPVEITREEQVVEETNVAPIVVAVILIILVIIGGVLVFLLIKGKKKDTLGDDDDYYDNNGKGGGVGLSDGEDINGGNVWGKKKKRGGGNKKGKKGGGKAPEGGDETGSRGGSQRPSGTDGGGDAIGMIDEMEIQRELNVISDVASAKQEVLLDNGLKQSQNQVTMGGSFSGVPGVVNSAVRTNAMRPAIGGSAAATVSASTMRAATAPTGVPTGAVANNATAAATAATVKPIGFAGWDS